MMILEAVIRGEYRYAERWSQMAGLIDEVMTNLAVEGPTSPWIVPGENACFMFVESRRPDPHRAPWPDNYLTVAVNTLTGYGGLTWFFSAERVVTVDDGIAAHVWVTDNPEPPNFDPRVVSDPCYPTFYRPSSTIPADQVRAALEEFCRTGTGDRPNCVSWVHGEMSGRRLDAEANIGINR
jgi:hypothetical protein